MLLIISITFAFKCSPSSIIMIVSVSFTASFILSFRVSELPLVSSFNSLANFLISPTLDIPFSAVIKTPLPP